jgi:hypothetical protein
LCGVGWNYTISKAVPKTTRTIKKGAIEAIKATKATLHQARRRLRKVAITRQAKDKKIKRSKTKEHAPAKQQISLRDYFIILIYFFF